MEAYKQRMIVEYRELKERAEKLATMLGKWDERTTDKPGCPKKILEEQLGAMAEYLFILMMRSCIENVDLDAPVDVAAPEEKAGWIPVTERMPEKGVQILVYAQSAHHVIAKYDSMLTEDGYRDMFVTYDAYHGMQEVKNVIEWMPLPDPYDGNGEENKNEDSGK